MRALAGEALENLRDWSCRILAHQAARSYVSGKPDPVLIVGSDAGRALNRMAGVPMCRAIPGWRSYLAAGGDGEIVKRTRERLKTGRPAGDAEFVLKLEEIVGRRLGAMPRGRPRKNVAALIR